MIIELLQEKHCAAIAELEKICFSEPWSENSVRSELDNELALWLVATEGDTLVGYVGSQSVMGEADMMNIAVSPDYRRKGIAEALVKELIHRLTQNGVHSLTLEVRASNTSAQNLYAKLGFERVGIRPKYYYKPTEDAWILRKEWVL